MTLPVTNFSLILTLDMNKVYGFEGEAKSKHGEQTYKLFADVFTARESRHVAASVVFESSPGRCGADRSAARYPSHRDRGTHVKVVSRIASRYPLAERKEAVPCRPWWSARLQRRRHARRDLQD